VQFLQAGGGKKKITVEVPVAASPAVVRRCLMDRLALPLSATLELSHAGRSLLDNKANNVVPGSVVVDWARFSAIDAVQLPVDTPLTLANADAHAAVAVRVELDSCRAGGADGVGAAPAATSPGWRLAVHDDGKPLGNGACGAVFQGTASFASTSTSRREVRVAVKKFFFLENPRLYGLMDAAAVADVVQRELLPEVNTLLALAHRNVVRLRCVGLGDVYGEAFPAYVAMDLCSEGTLAHWIKQQLLSDVVLVAFLGDLVDGMVYVRSFVRLHACMHA
jgi:hypothetical protein